MASERERKFLVPTLPARLSSHPHHLIDQGYLVVGEDGAEVRVRRIRRGRRQEFVLGYKEPDGEAREEVEVSLSREQFERLWPLTRGMRVQKMRYEVPLGGLKLEIDVYRGPLRGLAVAEVEFGSAAQLRSFEPPEWVGKDISSRSEFGNKTLARKGLPRKYNGGRRSKD